MRVAPRRCRNCRMVKRHTQATVNHVLHCLLTFVFIGLWFPVWMFLWWVSTFNAWRCNDCGVKNK